MQSKEKPKGNPLVWTMADLGRIFSWKEIAGAQSVKNCKKTKKTIDKIKVGVYNDSCAWTISSAGRACA